jgi:hypothetical protein
MGPPPLNSNNYSKQEREMDKFMGKYFKNENQIHNQPEI